MSEADLASHLQAPQGTGRGPQPSGTGRAVSHGGGKAGVPATRGMKRVKGLAKCGCRAPLSQEGRVSGDGQAWVQEAGCIHQSALRGPGVSPLQSHLVFLPQHKTDAPSCPQRASGPEQSGWDSACPGGLLRSGAQCTLVRGHEPGAAVSGCRLRASGKSAVPTSLTV